MGHDCAGRRRDRARSIRHIEVFSLAALAAFVAIGGGWHHFRWSDLAQTDLAWSITETPRPAWVRGVVSESRGIRHQRGGFGNGAGNEEKVSTRFVLDLTAISDGRVWHAASGRAVVIVVGDRSEIRAGQAVEAAGQIARVAPPLNPGEFDYRAFLQAQGIRLRLTVDDPESFWPDPSRQQLAIYLLAGQSQEQSCKSGCSSGSTRRSLLWPPPCSWAGEKRSIPRSTMRSLGPARPTCSRSRDSSCKPWPSLSCSCFALWAYPAGRPI